MTEVGRCHSVVFAFVNQDELRARRVSGKAAFEQVLADHTGRAGGKEADVVVLGDVFPARAEVVEAEGEQRATPERRPRGGGAQRLKGTRT